MGLMDLLRRPKVDGPDGGSARAQQVPPAIVSTMVQGYGSPGLSNQPDTKALLRENLGVADTATRAIANRVASLTPLVKRTRRVANGTEADETIDDHPLKDLLDRPHPTFSRTQLLRLTTQYLVAAGDAAWVKVGSELGVPVELHPLPPTMFEPVVSRGVVESYVITDANGRRSEVPRADVVRFYFPDPENPFKGEGYLGPNAAMVDAQKFATQQLRAHYMRDATPPTVLTPSPGAAVPTHEEWRAFLSEWEQRHNRRDGSGAGLPARLPEGWSLDELARDSGAAVTPLLEFWLESQLLNFGVPSSVLGRVVSGDRSSAETNQYVFDRYTIQPIATLLADAISGQLAGDFDSDVFVAFDDFVSADKDFELRREEQDLKLKVRSINKVLADRDDDPVEWGDQPIGTLADVVFDPDGDAAMSDDDPDALRGERVRVDVRESRGDAAAKAAWKRALAAEKRFTPKFERAVRSIIEQQRKATIAKVEGLTPRSRIDARDVFDPDAWRAEFERRVAPILRQIYAFAGAEMLASLVDGGQEFIFSTAVVERLKLEAARLATQTGRTTLSRIVLAIADAEAEGAGLSTIISRINQHFGKRRRDARTIARTEVLKANQAAQLEGMRQSGVAQFKRWNTALDEDVRDSHRINGQVVALDEMFTLDDGEQTLAPGGETLSAENVINCRCFITPEREG